MNKWVVKGLCLALALTGQAAHAELKWSGFATAAGATANVKFLDTGREPIYVEKIGRQINFDRDSVLGVDLEKEFDERFSLFGRIVAEGRRDWDVHATRAFFEYHAAKNWTWRVGRQPLQYLIYSPEYNESHAYPWIALPESVYHVIPFHYLDALSGRIDFEFWERVLRLSASYGSLTDETETPVTNVELKYKLRQVASLMASFGDEIFKVYSSYHVGRITWGPNAANELINMFINNTLIPAGFMGYDQQYYLTVDNNRLSHFSLGYTFNWKKVISAAEFLRRKSSSAIIPDINAWYVMLGCRYHHLIVFSTFARQRLMDNDTRRFLATANNASTLPPPAGLGRTLDQTVQRIAEGIDGPAAGDQTSISVGFRWDVTDWIAIKGSYEHIHPDRYGSGLFNEHPHRSVNVWRAGIDAHFVA